MEGTKISELPSASQINAGDVVAGVVNGNTSKIDVELLKGQKGDPGEAGPEGPQGPQGEPGQDGSDATVDIQQTTGTSTTAVMSQDATTKAVNAEATARDTAISAEAEARTEAIGAETTARTEAINAIQTQVQTDLQNYYTKTQTDQMISAIPKFAIAVVDSLPTTGISDTTVYLLKTGEASQNLYTEYIYVNGVWEELGTQTVDLTDYYTKEEVDRDFYTKSQVGNRLLINLLPAQSHLDVSQQARITIQRRDLQSAGSINENFDLPMATAEKAGCITAAERNLIHNAVPSSAISQSTGTSETAIMSQKAVSERLDEAKIKISNNTYPNLNMQMTGSYVDLTDIRITTSSQAILEFTFNLTSSEVLDPLALYGGTTRVRDTTGVSINIPLYGSVTTSNNRAVTMKAVVFYPSVLDNRYLDIRLPSNFSLNSVYIRFINL